MIDGELILDEESLEVWIETYDGMRTGRHFVADFSQSELSDEDTVRFMRMLKGAKP